MAVAVTAACGTEGSWHGERRVVGLAEEDEVVEEVRDGDGDVLSATAARATCSALSGAAGAGVAGGMTVFGKSAGQERALRTLGGTRYTASSTVFGCGRISRNLPASG